MLSLPGADWISEEEEWERLKPTTEILSKINLILSVDTFRPNIAQRALDLGVHIINDIFGGQQEGMFDVCAQYQAPIILMHKKGNPQNMQDNPQYENVVLEVFQFFNQQIKKALDKKCFEIIIDPGFGFGKSIQHNFELFKNISVFNLLNYPILIGISRKSMLTKTFDEKWKISLKFKKLCM